MVRPLMLRKVTTAKNAATALGFKETSERLQVLHSQLDAFKDTAEHGQKVLKAQWLSMHLDKTESTFKKEKEENREELIAISIEKEGIFSRLAAAINLIVFVNLSAFTVGYFLSDKPFTKGELGFMALSLIFFLTISKVVNDAKKRFENGVRDGAREIAEAIGDLREELNGYLAEANHTSVQAARK